MSAKVRTIMGSYRLVAALLWTSAAWAGVEPAGETTETTSGVVRASRPDLSAAAPRKVVAGTTLRCWQYGQLLFEEPVSTIPGSLAAQTHVFEGKPGGPAVQLIDMQSGICMVR
jgi:hypothetical protein